MGRRTDYQSSRSSNFQFLLLLLLGVTLFKIKLLRSLKGISYPGGARFAALSPCELDSLSDACDEQSDEDRDAVRAKKMRY
jgi:hypothetical protein